MMSSSSFIAAPAFLLYLRKSRFLYNPVSQPLIIPRVNPIAVLPVNGIPRFAIVDVIGKIAVAAAVTVELLPKIA